MISTGGPPFDPKTLLLRNASLRTATASLQGFDKSKYTELKQSWVADRDAIHHPETFKYPYPSDENLVDVLRAKIRSHVFKYVPRHVIKLPEMKLMDQTAVVQCVVEQKLKNAVKEIREREEELYRYVNLTGDDDVTRNERRAKVISAFIDDVTKFAILSHMWADNEPTYDDFRQQRNLHGQAYDKLKRFCEIAREEYGAEFAWADTVCIDKSSSTELDEAIRSMFAWYRNADICIAYVARTPFLVDLHADPWFTRGWTLQELLAPRRIKFYGKDWHPLTDFKNDKVLEKDVEKLKSGDRSLQLQLLQDAISAATGVDIGHIRNFQPGIHNPSVPERMKWMSRRVTTRGEDKLYSLMGVFGVSISIAYGEGPERAFFRLFQALLEVGCSLDWFLWIGNPVPSHIHPSNLIPSSPECYLSWKPEYSRGVRSLEDEPVSLTNAGLLIKMLVIPAMVSYSLTAYPDPDGLTKSRITCPLSDETLEISVSHEESVNYESEFALGVFQVPSDDTLPPAHVCAILLRRTVGRTPYLPGLSNKRWSYSTWKKCETNKTIVLQCNKKFRRMKFEDWTKVAVSRSEVGWEHEREMGDNPEISVQTLYL